MWIVHMDNTDMSEDDFTKPRSLITNTGSYGLIIPVLTGGMTKLVKAIEYHGVA